jgi:NAD(P)-dependent dehydrogenase (short-subunit alcohol dehydrogenase family)
MGATLQDQQVIVVGGGSGIGFATAVAAAEAGARVVVVGRSAEGLARAASAVPGARTARADVQDEEALAQLAAGLGTVDHVVVTAGSTRVGALLDREPVPDQLGPLRVRLHGAAHVLRAFHPVLRADGSVTLTGGVSSDRPVRGAWVSSVGTAATEQFARAMALELAPLRVNAVAPGWTDTPMWDAVLGADKDAVLAEAVKGQLTGRIVRPEEVAAAVVWLMSARSVTGEVVHVDGGARLT